MGYGRKNPQTIKIEATTDGGLRQDVDKVMSDLAQTTTQITTLETNKVDKDELSAGLAPKADQSYVDSKLANIVGGSPKGTYPTLSALQTAFPSGSGNIYVVSADGNWYYWNGSVWTIGGVYLGSPLDNVNVYVFPYNALYTEWEANSGLWFKLNASTNNFNIASTKTFSVFNYSDVLNQFADRVQSSPKGKTDCIKLNNYEFFVFEKSTETLKIVSYNAFSDDHVLLIGTSRGIIHSPLTTSEYLQRVDNLKLELSNLEVELQSNKDLTKLNLNPIFYHGRDLTFPRIDTVNKTLTFPAGQYDSGFMVDGTLYNIFSTSTPTTDIVVDITQPVGSSLGKILFNIQSKTFSVVTYNTSYDKKVNIVIGTIRYGGTTGINAYLVCPFYVDGVPYGMSTQTPKPEVLQMNLDDFVKGVAHRGYSKDAPENTLPAYKLAKEKGFSYVETDIQWTSDGVPVLLHDSTIDRTSNGTGNIGTMTLETVKTYDFGSWKGAEYTGTTIPTLEEFLNLCKKLNMHPYIELKGTTSSVQATTLVEIVKKLGMIRNVSWISFGLTALQEILNVLPSARVGYVGNITETFISEAVSLKTSQNDVFLDVNYSSLTTPLAESALLQDLPVEVYTVNGSSLIEGLVAMGVSGISTDFLNIAEYL